MALVTTLLATALLAAPQGELRVAAAVSLREPLSEIAREFEARHPGVRVRLGFGGSNLLAIQVRAGAPVDVLISADERIVDALVAEGRVPADAGARFALAGNRLVVMAAPRAVGSLQRPEDLAGESVRRIAVPENAVPVGRYAREWLERRGLLAALAPRLVPTEHARATLAAVDYGHVEAAIVYASDARLARSALLAFEVPADEQPRIRYAAARLAGTPRGTLADAFLSFLRGPEGRSALARAGLTAPETP